MNMDAVALLFEEVPAALYFCGAVLGLLVGSFLNVVVYRLPKMMQQEWARQCAELRDETPPERTLSLARPGSHCPQCQHPIGALENIPVLSYLLQKGRCRHCSASISSRYPLVEIVTAALTVFVLAQFGPTFFGIAAVMFTWVLWVLTLIDYDTQLLPDSLTLPLLWAGLLLHTAADSPVSLSDAVWGAAAGYGVLWIVFQAFLLLTGKRGMGHGDFKLLAALGAWLGWQMLPLVILLSSAVGAVAGMALMLWRQHQRSTPIPFGPYLAAAGWIALMWGDALTRAYLDWLGG